MDNKLNMKNKELILQIKYGGLGDHLFYSHIPRIAKKTGRYSRVFISEFSEFRDEEYKKLIWGTNPYIDGFIDKPGSFLHPTKTINFDKENLLDQIMLSFDIDDGKRFHEPELYITPPLRPKLTDASVYDPNYFSNVGRFTRRDLEKVIKQECIHINYQMAPRNKEISIKNVPNILISKNLIDFCGIIVSCKKLYCLTTGTATLATALGKPATVFYGIGLKKGFHHSKIHNYILINQSFLSKLRSFFIISINRLK